MALISHISKFLTIALLTFFIAHINAQTEVKFTNYYCFNRGTFTENSTYEANLVGAIGQLYNEAATSLSYNATVGSAPDDAYALYYCRGDLTLEVCQACVKQAALYVAKNCPNQREAVAWYEYCTLRYANRMILGQDDEERGAWWRSVEQVNDQGQFNKTVKAGLKTLIQEAISGNLTTDLYFATGEENLTSSETLYGLVQCSPDLSPDGCLSCLTNAANETNICCGGRTWAMMFFPSCQISYALSTSNGAPGSDAPALAPSDSIPSDSSPSDSTPSDSPPSDSSPSGPSSSSKSPSLPSITSISPSSSTSTGANSPPSPKSSSGPFHKSHGSLRQTNPSYAAVGAILMTVSAVLLSIGFES